MASRKRGISAWLVSWDYCGEHAKTPIKVVAVLNSRLSDERIRELVELLYANSEYDPGERIDYAKNRKNCPYPAEFVRLEDGVRWGGYIRCGHNPALEARKVDNLRADPAGPDGFVWNDRQRPRIRSLIEDGSKGPGS